MRLSYESYDARQILVRRSYDLSQQYILSVLLARTNEKYEIFLGSKPRNLSYDIPDRNPDCATRTLQVIYKKLFLLLLLSSCP